jgi:hypothetical protein
MTTAQMFVTRAGALSTLVFVDGRAQHVPASGNAALAVLLSGDLHCRIGVDEHARAPYCLMGICQDCQVRIDGAPTSRLGCLVPVRFGMCIERMSCAGDRSGPRTTNPDHPPCPADQ